MEIIMAASYGHAWKLIPHLDLREMSVSLQREHMLYHEVCKTGGMNFQELKLLTINFVYNYVAVPGQLHYIQQKRSKFDFVGSCCILVIIWNIDIYL